MSDEAAIMNYEGDQEFLVRMVQAAMEHDTVFLASWLHSRSEKTRRAYEGDIRKF